MLALYFAMPVDTERAPVGVVAGVLISIAALVGVAIVVIDEVRGAERLRGRHLVLVLEIALVVFSFAYYVIATNEPGHFTDLNTRVDALYFATSTAATVGFGDVHPTGQTARGLVTAHMIFNFVFIAAVVNLATNRMSGRRVVSDGTTHTERNQDA